MQRLRMKIMAFNFKAVWRKGATNQAPDTLSCNPIGIPTPKESLAEGSDQPLSTAEIRSIHQGNCESVRLREVRQQATEDSDYQELKQYIMEGFPDYRGFLLEAIKPFWQVRQHLSVEDELIVYRCRLVIPRSFHRQTLSQLHEAHQGATRTKQRARLTVYWPLIDHDIDQMVLACRQCQDYLPSQAQEPIVCKAKPLTSFQEIASDFCYYAGKHYLLVVDTYTDLANHHPHGKGYHSYPHDCGTYRAV